MLQLRVDIFIKFELLMADFLTKVWSEYPLPTPVSYWGDHSDELQSLLDTVIDEVQSDIRIVEESYISSIRTAMPSSCKKIISARLQLNLQGNNYVKTSFYGGVLYLRYTPCFVKWERGLESKDLDTLKGDRFIYLKSYFMWKMANKDIVILSSINLNADNASLNLDNLIKFRDECKSKVEELKPEILIYANS
nr:MAG TPA: hypothetical protein [Caudoviricetes sp.]